MSDVGRKSRLRVIGLMSGTSMDGVDAAMIETDGNIIFEFGPTEVIHYTPAFRKRLRSILGRPTDNSAETSTIVRELTLYHAKVVERLLRRKDVPPSEVDLIGFHGQTVFHAPKEGITNQIGDAIFLAKITGIDVVGDFRSADVVAGGEGAPLAPIYHLALSKTLARPIVVLNLGGVGNVSWISEKDDIIAFDTGPANALIDDWVFGRTGQALDKGGRLARSGKVQKQILTTWLSNPYFDQPVPKSLDRDQFSNVLADLKDISVEDGAATLAAFAVEVVIKGRRHFPSAPLRWLVTGGGRHNSSIMENLKAKIDAPVEPVEAVGWDGDALEAQAFAFLAARTMVGLPITFPTTTGVDRPLRGGKIFKVS
ncbi:MAG: anhydro-N-acetylmuramic acid kinase [Magnetovibrio sp.]|nr:anhydro-N-acetylmuramic acid kinase [Magnetovibrio sp.]